MMKNRIITKIAGFICSAVMLAMLGLTASAQTDRSIEERQDIVENMINFVGGTVEAEAEEIVMFPIYICNNNEDGFTSVHLRLLLVEELLPAFKADGTPIVKKGIGADDDEVELNASYDADASWINLEINSTKPITETGILARVALSLPEDVRDAYAIRLEIDRNAENNLPDCAALNGTIYTVVQTEPATVPAMTEAVTTTNTTAAVPATRAAAVTTIAFAATNPLIAFTVPERTTAPVLSVGYGKADVVSYHSAGSYSPVAVIAEDAGTDNSGTTTGEAVPISYDEMQSGTTETTDTTDTANTEEIGISSAQTGDFGIGIAVTGFLLAAGTAVVTVIRKRK